MSSSSPSPPFQQGEASSSRDPPRQTTVEDENDDEDALLSSDPLEGQTTERISFKRKQKASKPGLSMPRFFSATTDANRDDRPFLPSQAPSSRDTRARSGTDSTEVILNYLDSHGDAGPQLQDAKHASAMDWYVEGPGRRVGYDDLTAIDWIFEYAKDRQRLRFLFSDTSGIMGHLRQLADASQIWWILIAAGIASGAIAAFIDIASDWLGDLKTGVCKNVEGDGHFYLSKPFCCWGYSDLSQCHDWHPWSSALGVRSAGGGYIIEYIFFVVFSVSFAAFASLLVQNYAPYARHSGIPEIKTVLGGFVIRRFLGVWTLAIKSLGLCLAVASGLWLGKEGPLVHVACCCANLFMKFFTSINDNEARKREVLSAAAAAGISVAFGSPIGGVLFSLEQLSYYFPDKTMWQSFVCAMVAAVTLQACNPFRTGKLVLYQVTYHSGWHAFEMVPFALLGVLGGLYGGLFIKLNMFVAKWRQANPIFKDPVVEVVSVALLTSITNFPIKFMRAQASELVYTLFAECVDITDDQLGLCKSGKANTGVVALLIISALLGFLLAAVTFGLQIPAGIILPSIAVGALYGRAVGLTVEVWQQAHPGWLPFASCEPDRPCVTPGTYAIIGAASALGGATRMTVSIVVIMFELTGALTYVLPIMIAVMLSKWIGDAISPKGIYESWIHFKGYPFLDNRDENSASIPDVPASRIFTKLEDCVVITVTGHTIQSLQDLLKQHTFRGFPVIDTPRDALLLGYISRTELAFALNSALTSRSLFPETEAYFSHQPLSDPTCSLDLRPWMDQTPITLNFRASFQLTLNMFQRLGLRYVLFNDRGTLKGLLTKKDVWYVLNANDDENGVLREENEEQEEGLLGDSSHENGPPSWAEHAEHFPGL
ncbi:hypothetical protein EJ05DRAFT_472443 [Pseudovirgaria hyperparasitica]|uniref:Chloride channel protein n=1 Tax=Pseudovirgaria hyperparasitica TaxID=470096 RepID=A0A6A6WMU4_9PEZI|nr:uncharacterized protein EJ05DRAFT_472443 [Pseudovirgaria hyperparasitica]KAF2763545.1 hypothetical protein EJ05DRAFT_472443 [Pseudovirgaria hyperparasitica]